MKTLKVSVWLTLTAASLSWASIQINHQCTITSTFPIHHAKISAAGNIAVLGSEYSRNIRIYDAYTGQLNGQYTLPEDCETESLALSANGQIIAAGVQGSDDIYILNSSGGLINSFSAATLSSQGWKVSITNDGSTIYAGVHNQFIKLRVSDGTILENKTIETDVWSIWEVSLSETAGKVLLRTNSDIIITDTSGNVLSNYDIVEGNNMTSGDLSPEGDMFAVQYNDPDGEYRNELYTINGTEKWSEANTYYCRRISLDSNGYTYFTDADGYPCFYSEYGGRAAQYGDIHYGNIVDSIPSGMKVITASSNSTTAKVYNIYDIWTSYDDLPRPEFRITDYYPDGRVNIELLNSEAYPDQMFEEAPELAPCGLNYNSSRSWVLFYNQDDLLIYGSCAIDSAEDFRDLKYPINREDHEGVYMQIWDRKADMYYNSRLQYLDDIRPAADVNGDYLVDLGDVALMAKDWLREVLSYVNVNWWDIDERASGLSSDSIDASDGNRFGIDSFFIYETNEGRYGKFIIDDYDESDNHAITISWKTYDYDGSLYSEGSGLTIVGTYSADLDEGVLSPYGSGNRDFSWTMSSSETRFLTPKNGASFKIIYRADAD
ncbi:hypothetical protein L21SP3_00846 [Sedimentisphaera cyanobacteriorum]|uniref:Uncharacterized protein n=1 Tax=Sedimentisphaera cyanobacteriorum TaxID=1940790 RepID=A0A1Q2HNK2_9BACT|nr:hypothetical protein [Sedimentisphaera cyanobacteriorum]AQQ09048.1 hypothetical protein L21SP3_00846 [Sedimentisphaera cyanobacteriorum]